jgi:hypothetical protein
MLTDDLCNFRKPQFPKQTGPGLGVVSSSAQGSHLGNIMEQRARFHQRLIQPLAVAIEQVAKA